MWNNIRLESSPVLNRKSILKQKKQTELNAFNQNENNLLKLEVMISWIIWINPNDITNYNQNDINWIKQKIIKSPDKMDVLIWLNKLQFCPIWWTYISEIIEESILDLDKYIIAEDIYYKIQSKSWIKLENITDWSDKEKKEINKIREILFNEANFKREWKPCNLWVLKWIVKIEKEYNIKFSDQEKNLFFQDTVRNRRSITALEFNKYIEKNPIPNPPINENKFYSPTNEINANYLTYIINDKSLKNTEFKKHASLYLIAIRRQNNASKINSHNISLATKLSSNATIHSEEIILELDKINTIKPWLDFLESWKIDNNGNKINTRDAIKEILINNNIDKTNLFESWKSVFFILSELGHGEREALLDALKRKWQINKDYKKLYNIVLSLDILDKELDERQNLAMKWYSVDEINKKLEEKRKINANAFIAIQPIINQNEYINKLEADWFKHDEINIIHLWNNLYKVKIAWADFWICDSSKKEVANVIDTAKFLKELWAGFLFPYIDLILYELKSNASSNIWWLKLDIKNWLDIYEKAYLFRIISKLIFWNSTSIDLDNDNLNTEEMKRSLTNYVEINYRQNITNKSLDYRFIAGEIENKRLKKNEIRKEDIWISENWDKINIIALLKRIREINTITK